MDKRIVFTKEQVLKGSNEFMDFIKSNPLFKKEMEFIEKLPKNTDVKNSAFYKQIIQKIKEEE